MKSILRAFPIILYVYSLFVAVCLLLISAEKSAKSETNDCGDDDMQPSVGKTPISTIQTQTIESCPVILSKNLPGDNMIIKNFTEPLAVYLNFNLYRFLGIDDIAQTLSVLAELVVFWYFPNCQSSTCLELFPTCTGRYAAMMLYFRLPQKQVWNAGLGHMNAMQVIRPLFEMTDHVKIYFCGDSGPSGELSAFGRYETFCTSFSYARFPLDTQTCELIFQSDHPEFAVTFNSIGISLYDPESPKFFIDDAEIWAFASLSDRYERTNVVGANYSIIIYSLTFKRKYSYYVGNVFVPTISLFILQLIVLVMEPELPDRPAICTTVVLAYSVILTMVFGSIPKTSEIVYLVLMVEIKFMASLAVAMYCIITCTLGATYRWHTKVDFLGLKKMSRIRIVDVYFSLTMAAGIAVVDVFLFYKMIA